MQINLILCLGLDDGIPASAKDWSSLRVSKTLTRAPRIFRCCNCLVRSPLHILCRKAWACPAFVTASCLNDPDSTEQAGEWRLTEETWCISDISIKIWRDQSPHWLWAQPPSYQFMVEARELREARELLRQQSHPRAAHMSLPLPDHHPPSLLTPVAYSTVH